MALGVTAFATICGFFIAKNFTAKTEAGKRIAWTASILLSCLTVGLVAALWVP